MLTRISQKRAFATVASKKVAGKTYNVPNKLFINGEWQDAASGATIDVINPGTGEFITKCASAQIEDVDRAVQASLDAAEAWENVPAFVKAKLLNDFADKMLDHADELATLECEDNGKPYDKAIGDVHFASSIVRYYAGLGQNIKGISSMRDNHTYMSNSYAYTRKEPIGVCGLITPWNYPLLMTTFKIAPMLASGCTGVAKTPELTPLSSLRLVELWHEVEGVIPGVLNATPGLGDVAAERLVDHKSVRKIAFTGSTRVGKRIMQRSAETMKRTTLELGGKGPLIIFDDADLDKAAMNAATIGLQNTGQFCGASTRIIVEEGVYDEVLEKLVKNVQGYNYGYWREEGITHGPVISQAQMDKILGYIESGKEEGARLLIGGNRIDRPGFFVEGTIFADCTPDMKIVREEIFGPVLSVLKFKSGEDNVQNALKIANDSDYGLIGGAFSSDRRKLNLVARKLQCGHVGKNTYMGIGYDVPFGGYKMSGYGRELSQEGLDSYLETKTINVDESTP